MWVAKVGVLVVVTFWLGMCVGLGVVCGCVKARYAVLFGVLKFSVRTHLIGVQCFCDCDLSICPFWLGFVSLESRHDFLHFRHWFC